MVKCRVCGKLFDKDALPQDEWIMPSRNYYYHTSCYQNWRKAMSGDNELNEEQFWTDSIYDFIARDLKGKYDWFMCEAQRKKYIESGRYTCKGIYFALKYFYEVKGNDWSKGHGGLGIIPYCYDEAVKYWVDQEDKKAGFMAGIEQILQDRCDRGEIKHVHKAGGRRKVKQYDLTTDEDEWV